MKSETKAPVSAECRVPSAELGTKTQSKSGKPQFEVQGSGFRVQSSQPAAPALPPGTAWFASPTPAGMMQHDLELLAECTAEILHEERHRLLKLVAQVRDRWARLRLYNALALAETVCHGLGQPTELDRRERTRLRRLAAGLAR